jgi:hypothetical protein
MRQRLAKYLDPADFVQQPIKKSKIKFDYGTRTVTESIFLPKANIRNAKPTRSVERPEQKLRRLRSAASDCGVSLSNEALSSDGLYE